MARRYEPEKADNLKEYEVLLNGVPTTVQLSEEEYKRQGWQTPSGGGPAEREKQGAALTSSAKAKPTTTPNKARGE